MKYFFLGEKTWEKRFNMPSHCLIYLKFLLHLWNSSTPVKIHEGYKESSFKRHRNDFQYVLNIQTTILGHPHCWLSLQKLLAYLIWIFPHWQCHLPATCSQELLDLYNQIEHHVGCCLKPWQPFACASSLLASSFKPLFGLSIAMLTGTFTFDWEAITFS